MADNIKVRVSADLHPENVEHLDGYDDDTAVFLGATRDAFDTAYKFVDAIYDVREAALSDPTLTPAAAILKTDDFANKRLSSVTKLFDSTIANLGKSIDSYERELTAPVMEKGARLVAQEVRSHLKGLKPEERHKTIQQAHDNGDEVVMCALLGAPALLSGVTDEMQAVYLRLWREKSEPVKAQRLRAMRAAKERLENRGGLVLKEMIKAVGYVTDPATKRKITPDLLRKQKAAAERVYAANA